MTYQRPQMVATSELQQSVMRSGPDQYAECGREIATQWSPGTATDKYPTCEALGRAASAKFALVICWA